MTSSFISLAASVAVFALPLADAHANLLLNGDFSSTAAGTSFPVGSYTASGTTGWLDQATWATVSGNGTNHPNPGEAAAPASPSGGNWARQFAGANTNIGTMLMQGFSASAITAGTTLTLSFEYITDDAETAYFRVYGMDAAETFSQFPPNNCTSCDLLIPLINSNLSTNLGQWSTFSTTFALPRQFNSIAFGVYFGSNTTLYPTYVGGIDNVSVAARSSAVPEPATLALLGLGLAGLGYSRRRTH